MFLLIGLLLKFVLTQNILYVIHGFVVHVIFFLRILKQTELLIFFKAHLCIT